MHDSNFWNGVGGQGIASNLKMSSFFMASNKIITSICATYDPKLPWNPLSTLIIYFNLGSSDYTHAFYWEVRMVIFVTRKQLLVYREVQLLIEIFNDIHKNFMMGFIIFSVIITTIVSANLLVLSNTTLDFGAILVIGPIFLNTLITMGVSFRVPAAIFSLSKDTLIWTRSNVLSRIPREKDKAFYNWAKIYWRSFPSFKIQFFAANYFEKRTPLVIMDFCFIQVINLALLR
ncbi:unnamed protein product [Orchesella dallaii]|uniref:Uncharacterized protein n=1 Tax=Orchesella dallaii TaxID=48710 RepID=A0ABP1QCF6_9HEXA